jgi:hypothetical protein
MTKNAKSNPQDDLAKLQASPHDVASWQHAQQYLLNGRHAPALASYRNLVKQFPGVSQLWAASNIIVCAAWISPAPASSARWRRTLRRSTRA